METFSHAGLLRLLCGPWLPAFRATFSRAAASSACARCALSCFSRCFSAPSSWRRRSVGRKGRLGSRFLIAPVSTKPGLMSDVGLFARLGQVRAQRRLQRVHVDRFLHLRLDLLERRRRPRPGGCPRAESQSPARADGRRDAAGRQGEGRVFEHLARACRA